MKMKLLQWLGLQKLPVRKPYRRKPKVTVHLMDGTRISHYEGWCPEPIVYDRDTRESPVLDHRL